MAKLKSTASRGKRSATSAKPAKASKAGTSKAAAAEALQKSIVESAQQIWLAGMGAFGRAQAEGTKLFEGLVKEGGLLEQSTRKLAGHRVDAVRDVVEERVGQVRERAADTWDRLEKVFEDRVQRALTRLGVPTRDELAALSQRVEQLVAELRKLNGGTAPKGAKAAPKAAAKPAPKAAKAPKARKAASKPAPKKAAPKAAKPAARKPAARRVPAVPAPVTPGTEG
jgi:poly(hydroxyalkanoate) granule-associated protein